MKHRALGRGSALLFAALVPAVWAGCGEDPPAQPQRGRPPVQQQQPKAQQPGKQAQADAGADASAELALPPLPPRDIKEADFAETDRNRDPFRSYEDLFVTQAKGRVTVQREVLADPFALDELKLVGVVTRSPARALFTDPTGFGWVAKVGDFIGRAELVQTGGPAGTDVAINWRIERIRDGDVVFVREDPSHPDIPPATRVVALYPVTEAAPQNPPRRR